MDKLSININIQAFKMIYWPIVFLRNITYILRNNGDMNILTSAHTVMKAQPLQHISNTVKPVLSGHSKKDQKLGFQTDYRLMQVKSIAECSNRSILQYFRPSLSYHLSLRSVFYLF